MCIVYIYTRYQEKYGQFIILKKDRNDFNFGQLSYDSPFTLLLLSFSNNCTGFTLKHDVIL